MSSTLAPCPRNTAAPVAPNLAPANEQLDDPVYAAPPSLGSVSGTQVGIVVSTGSSRQLVEHVKRRFEEAGAAAEIVAATRPHGAFDDRTQIFATHTLTDKPAVAFDFLVALPGLPVETHVGQEITEWTSPLRTEAKPIAVGSLIADQLGLHIDNAHIFDVRTCDAFVQVCKNFIHARPSNASR